MEIKINQPSNSKINPTPQQNLTINSTKTQNLNLEQLIQLLLQQVQKQQLMQNNNANQTPQNLSQNNTNSGEYIIKSGMKASVIAVRVEQMLLFNKRITLSGLGYAVPILLDSVMLIRKDYAKLNKNLVIENIELFENKFNAKTVTGLKITLKLQ